MKLELNLNSEKITLEYEVFGEGKPVLTQPVKAQ
jgi:hypothetical protein